MRQSLILAALLLSSATFAADVRLTVFDCGVIEFDDVSTFGLSNDETPVRALFVPCYLIEHPIGRMIWDAGLPDAIAGQGEQILQPGVSMTLDVSLAEQLAAMDIAATDIDLVAFSHMHYDHVGAGELFTRAKLLIQDTEYKAAFEEPDNPYFQPDLYMGLKDNPREILSGDYDVFGDGSVTIVSAPGHTPGHQVLLLQLNNMGPLMLSGDLYHFAESRALRRAPEFNVDAEQTFRSMDKVEALIKSTGATLWIEHEQALAQSLSLAPAFYD